LNITDGPLRAAIVGPEGLVTNSTYWVKYAVKMEIIAGSVGGLIVPVDEIAIITNLGIYLAAAFLIASPAVILIAVKRKHIAKKQ